MDQFCLFSGFEIRLKLRAFIILRVIMLNKGFSDKLQYTGVLGYFTIPYHNIMYHICYSIAFDMLAILYIVETVARTKFLYFFVASSH